MTHGWRGGQRSEQTRSPPDRPGRAEHRNRGRGSRPSCAHSCSWLAAWSLKLAASHELGAPARRHSQRTTDHELRIRGLPFSPLSPYDFTTPSLALHPPARAIRATALFTLVKTPLNSRLHSIRRAPAARASRNRPWRKCYIAHVAERPRSPPTSLGAAPT